MTTNAIVNTPPSPFDPSGQRRARVISTNSRITRVQFIKGYSATFATKDLQVAK